MEGEREGEQERITSERSALRNLYWNGSLKVLKFTGWTGLDFICFHWF